MEMVFVWLMIALASGLIVCSITDSIKQDKRLDKLERDFAVFLDEIEKANKRREGTE